MSKLIIGIAGRARSGKSTISQAIQEACVDRYDCKQYELSSYVLKEAQARRVITPNLKREELSPKELDLLVDYGLSGRKIDPLYWLEYLGSDIANEKPEIAVVPNIRFENEAAFIRQGLRWVGYEGIIIRSKTFIFDGVEYISRDRDPNNIMEIEQEKIEADYFITVKRGNPELTKSLAKTIFEHILAEKR